eukprot:TRINITY_DN6201_c0_g1_i2.p1 TRINITY_DN6201_c0_g1~~TRINITY_DN6201_c0_g1_i2.p1  ORF type:complete len:1073 (+),score=116.77 TRINITY_DN6201_c0_g1_i2:78-3221(+)
MGCAAAVSAATVAGAVLARADSLPPAAWSVAACPIECTGTGSFEFANPVLSRRDFSVALLVRTTTSGGVVGGFKQGLGIVDAGDASGVGDFGLNIAQGTPVFGVDGASVQALKAVNDGGWHSVVATRQAFTGRISLYVDGGAASTATGGASTLSAPRMAICGRTGKTGLFTGELANLLLFAAELSPLQAQDFSAVGLCPMPTAAPRSPPSVSPTSFPTRPPQPPSPAPTAGPTASPVPLPSAAPRLPPTAAPSRAPSGSPTAIPTKVPTGAPSREPSAAPTEEPSRAPSQLPSAAPSERPTVAPSTVPPTAGPTVVPTHAPTWPPSAPPSTAPTSAPPTAPPYVSPSPGPSGAPSAAPSATPTNHLPLPKASTAAGVTTLGASASSPGSATVLAVISGTSCADTEEEDATVSVALHPSRVSVDGSMHKGCVVANIALMLLFSVMHRAVLRPLAALRRVQLIIARGTARFPGLTFHVACFLAQATAQSAAHLATYGDTPRWQAVGVCGVVLAPVLLMRMYCLLVTVPKSGKAVDDPRVVGSCILRWIMGDRWWVSTNKECFVECYGLLFRTYRPRRTMFMLCEVSYAYVMAIFNSRKLACPSVRWIMATVSLAFLGIQIGRLPYLRPRDTLLEILVSALTVLTLVMQALYLGGFEHSPVPQLTEVLPTLVTALLVIKALLDLVSALWNIWTSRTSRIRRHYGLDGSDNLDGRTVEMCHEPGLEYSAVTVDSISQRIPCSALCRSTSLPRFASGTESEQEIFASTHTAGSRQIGGRGSRRRRRRSTKLGSRADSLSLSQTGRGRRKSSRITHFALLPDPSSASEDVKRVRSSSSPTRRAPLSPRRRLKPITGSLSSDHNLRHLPISPASESLSIHDAHGGPRRSSAPSGSPYPSEAGRSSLGDSASSFLPELTTRAGRGVSYGGSMRVRVRSDSPNSASPPLNAGRSMRPPVRRQRSSPALSASARLTRPHGQLASGVGRAWTPPVESLAPLDSMTLGATAGTGEQDILAPPDTGRCERAPRRDQWVKRRVSNGTIPRAVSSPRTPISD